MDKSSAPPAPDFKGAAEANHFNQYTPFGSQTWTSAQPATSGYWKPGTKPGSSGSSAAKGFGHFLFGTPLQPQGSASDPNWVPGSPATPASSTITLDPRAQAALESQLRLSEKMGGLAEGYAGQVANQGPMDLSSVPQIADKAYSAFTSRLDPQWAQREQMQKTQLANQGLNPGTEAYTNAMRDFNQGRNDAYQQANLGAIQTMPQTYQLAQAAYDQPLNRLNALRTGAQVNTPQFQPNNVDALQAAIAQSQYGQGLYNANVGQQNAMMSGLFGLGAAALPFIL